VRYIVFSAASSANEENHAYCHVDCLSHLTVTFCHNQVSGKTDLTWLTSCRACEAPCCCMGSGIRMGNSPPPAPGGMGNRHVMQPSRHIT
jgi:hypothetical protein